MRFPVFGYFTIIARTKGMYRKKKNCPMAVTTREQGRYKKTDLFKIPENSLIWCIYTLILWTGKGFR